MSARNVSRRWFIGGAASFGAFAGCRVFADELGLHRGPGAKLKVGIVSDIHILKADYDGICEGDTRVFEKTLAYFRDRGADAVMICGDMADKGLTDQLMLVSEAWYRVFPNDKAPDGRHVEKLFVYGNHDIEGQNYGPFAKELHPDPEDYKRHLVVTDRAAAWEQAFHEPYAPIYLKEVNGYPFIGGQWDLWSGIPKLVPWFAENGKRLNPRLPILYGQHPHPQDTCYGSWAWGHDGGWLNKALGKNFPNLIAFSGHSHYSLTDERSIWQGDFTSVGTGSLRYPGVTDDEYKLTGRSYSGPGRDPLEKLVRNGLFMSIYEDRIVWERRDFAHDLSLGADWVMPLPVAEPKPFAFVERAKKSVVPAFAAGAQAVAKLVTGNRKSHGADGVVVTFPSVPAPVRAIGYDICVLDAEGKERKSKGCIPPDYARAAENMEKEVSCRFSVRELPSGQTVRFAVKPRESFGKTGAPLLTAPLAVPDWAPKLPTKDKFHLYLLVGQSNMAGRGALGKDAGSVSAERVLKLAKDDQWDVGEEPLHFDKKTAGAGLGASFARKMADAEPDVTVGLIPCAVGGSPIKRWAKGADLYTDAMRRAKIAMRDGTLKGILWHQGESDATDPKNAAAWSKDFAEMVAAMRAELGDVPVVAGELGHYLKENRNAKGAPAYPGAPALNAELHAAEGKIAKFAVASAEGLAPNKDNLHFDTPSLRVFGERYAAAMFKLRSEFLGF